MWIAFRLVLALVGFAIRVAGRRPKLDPTGEIDDVPYRVKVRRNKWGIVGFSLRMPRRSPTWLRMHSETEFDRWAKRLRVSRELETGDPRFDELVYVTCDHPHVENSLARSASLRDAICEVFEAGYRKVEFDGTSVVIDRKSSVGPTQGDLELLSNLHGASALLERDVSSRLADPFLWKALIFEGFIWSLFGYAVGALFQLVFERQPLFVSPGEVVRLGLSVAAAAFVALLSLIAFVMRGSSRGHRIVVESAVILLLGMPAASIQLVADTNRALDTEQPKRWSVAVLGCEVREHRNKHGRLSYTYHLMLAPEPSVTGNRDSFNVSQALCSAADATDHAEIVVGPGRWSLPWYREITVGTETWSASF